MSLFILGYLRSLFHCRGQKKIDPYQPPSTLPPRGSFYYEVDILNFNLNILRLPVLAILMDPPWHLITPKQLSTLKFTDKVIPYGLVFIWIEKELIPDILEIMSKWGFFYVENLVWVKHTVNNKNVHQPYKYFKKSKMTLLIFRKIKEGEKMELRHQRNCDVLFDFVTGLKSENQENKPTFIYTIIETLLPEAEYKESTKCGKFLELWASKNTRREGWTTLVQK